MTDKDHVIWTSDIDLDSFRDFLEDEHPDVTDEIEQYRLCAELNDEYLEDERANLNIDLHREIICIGYLQTWHGFVTGYKEVKGTCISDCLKDTCGDYATWYVDARGDLWCKDIHHDGTNRYFYRVFRPGLSFWQKDNFKDKVARGEVSRRDINRYTERLGDLIADVYGWKIRKLPVRKKVG